MDTHPRQTSRITARLVHIVKPAATPIEAKPSRSNSGKLPAVVGRLRRSRAALFIVPLVATAVATKVPVVGAASLVAVAAGGVV
jgi:hypothetical protein